MAFPMALALGLAKGAGSLISGLSAAHNQKEQYHQERQRLQILNDRNRMWTDKLNQELRARADAAALVPVETTSTVDMAGFLAAAEMAGFNKLSFLRSGALSLFTKVSTTGERAMDAALAGDNWFQEVSTNPNLGYTTSSGEAVGDAISSGADAFMSEWQREAQNNFQLGLLQTTLAAKANMRLGSVVGLGSSPHAVLSGGVTSVQGGGTTGGGGKPGTVKLTDWLSWIVGNDKPVDESDLVKRYDDAGRMLEIGRRAFEDWKTNNPEIGSEADKGVKQALELTNMTAKDIVRVFNWLNVLPSAGARARAWVADQFSGTKVTVTPPMGWDALQERMNAE